jgi:dienelactone hydrolase
MATQSFHYATLDESASEIAKLHFLRPFDHAINYATPNRLTQTMISLGTWADFRHFYTVCRGEDMEPIECQHGDLLLRGFMARPTGSGPFPGVLVMHSALGLAHMVKDIAHKLAALGYLAVATDMYGADAVIETPEQAGPYYMALLQSPEVLRARTATWFDAVAALPDVDAAKIAAIGYCFGGKCVLELARSGRDVKAAVSYHGLLTTHAPAQPGDITGEVAAWCGALDPFGPHDETEAFRLEMIAAEANWQITEFGKVAHGFTDAKAEGGMPGIEYNLIADKTSWAGTLALLEVVFA